MNRDVFDIIKKQKKKNKNYNKKGIQLIFMHNFEDYEEKHFNNKYNNIYQSALAIKN